MQHHARSLLIAALLASGAVALSQGTPLYSTGFEALSNGPLDGQDGWVAIGSTPGGTVQTNIFFAGTKAFMVDSAVVVADSWYSRLFPVATPGRLVQTFTVEWRMRVSMSGTASPFWGFDVTTDGGFTRFCAFGVDGSQRVGAMVGDGALFVPSGQTVVRGDWNLFRVHLDFGTRRMTGSLNGVTVMTASLNPVAAGRTVYDAAMTCGDPLAVGTDRAYFDEIKVSALAAFPGGQAGGGLL